MPYLLMIVALITGFHTGGSGRMDESSSAVFMEWREEKPLSWNDFRGRAPSSSPLSALTASAIEYSYDCDGGRLEITVRAIFIPGDSWVRADARNAYILAHEQLHFDITEIYARKLRRELQGQVFSCRDTRKIETIARQVLDGWKKAQHHYDRETDHSLKRPEQEAWAGSIGEQLQRYAAFREESWIASD